MSKVEIFCKIKKRNIFLNKKLADALVRSKRAEYATKVMVPETTVTLRNLAAELGIQETPAPSVTDETTTLVTDEAVVDEKAQYKKILDEAGVEYDGRAGLNKLKELVAEIDKEEE